MSHVERAVLMLVRRHADPSNMGAVAGAEDGPAAAIRAMLTEVNRGKIRAPGAPYVSDAELDLVAGLASAQRMIVAKDPVTAGVHRCASSLFIAGYRLPFRAMLRGRPNLQARSEPPPRLPGKSRASGTARTTPRQASLRTTAILMARGRDSLSAKDFIQIGISRQYLSRLCAYGDFVRIGPARYRIANAD